MALCELIADDEHMDASLWSPNKRKQLMRAVGRPGCSLTGPKRQCKRSARSAEALQVEVTGLHGNNKPNELAEADPDLYDLLTQVDSLFTASNSVALPRLGSSLSLLAPERLPNRSQTPSWFRRLLAGYVNLSAASIWPVGASLDGPPFWVRFFGMGATWMTFVITCLWFYFGVFGLETVEQGNPDSRLSYVAQVFLWLFVILLNQGAVYRIFWTLDIVLGAHLLSDRRSRGHRLHALVGLMLTLVFGYLLLLVFARLIQDAPASAAELSSWVALDQLLPLIALIILPALSAGFVFRDLIITTAVALERAWRNFQLRSGVDLSPIIRNILDLAVPIGKKSNVNAWWPAPSVEEVNVWLWKSTSSTRLKAIREITLFRRESKLARAAAGRGSQQIIVGLFAAATAIGVPLYFSDTMVGEWMRATLGTAYLTLGLIRVNQISVIYSIVAASVIAYVMWTRVDRLEDEAFVCDLVVEACYTLEAETETAGETPVVSPNPLSAAESEPPLDSSNTPDGLMLALTGVIGLLAFWLLRRRGN